MAIRQEISSVQSSLFTSILSFTTFVSIEDMSQCTVSLGHCIQREGIGICNPNFHQQTFLLINYIKVKLCGRASSSVGSVGLGLGVIL